MALEGDHGGRSISYRTTITTSDGRCSVYASPARILQALRPSNKTIERVRDSGRLHGLRDERRRARTHAADTGGHEARRRRRYAGRVARPHQGAWSRRHCRDRARSEQRAHAPERKSVSSAMDCCLIDLDKRRPLPLRCLQSKPRAAGRRRPRQPPTTKPWKPMASPLRPLRPQKPTTRLLRLLRPLARLLRPMTGLLRPRRSPSSTRLARRSSARRSRW